MQRDGRVPGLGETVVANFTRGSANRPSLRCWRSEISGTPIGIEMISRGAREERDGTSERPKTSGAGA